MTTNLTSADSFYDPEFTADISNKMQVPQRISVIDQDETAPPKLPDNCNVDTSLFMHVPERILVTGGSNNEEGLDQSYDSLKEGNWFLEQPQTVKLRHKATLSTIPNGDITGAVGCLTPPAEHHTDEDLNTVRRHMRTLNRRMMLLEQDNQQRQQREVVLYSVGVLYFLLKGIFWLQRNW